MQTNQKSQDTEYLERIAFTREARAATLAVPVTSHHVACHCNVCKPQNLKLRFNFQLNAWQVWNYLSRASKNNRWQWFTITPDVARRYAEYAVPVSVEDTLV